MEASPCLADRPPSIVPPFKTHRSDRCSPSSAISSALLHSSTRSGISMPSAAALSSLKRLTSTQMNWKSKPFLSLAVMLGPFMKSV
jgi:hypothetical protein